MSRTNARGAAPLENPFHNSGDGVFAIPMIARVTARWARLALPSAPCTRSSHGMSVIGRQAYVFGGEHTARHAINSTLHCLDMAGADPAWRDITLEHAPPARVGHVQAAVDGKLIIFGGRNGVDMGETALDDLWSWCPLSSEWTLWTPSSGGGGPPPAARSYHASTASGSKLYVFGGCGADGRLADLHEFDTTTQQWTQLASPPDVSGRGGATLEASADGRFLWLMCGFAGHETNDLLRFCLSSHSWERRPSDWLRPRSVCASFATSSGVFLFGGEVSASAHGHEGAGSFAADLLRIDPRDGAPLSVVVESPADADAAATPRARGWAAAAALSDSQAVLFGGLSGSDEAPERLDDAWLLTLESETST